MAQSTLIALALLAAMMLHCCAIGPLTQINSLVKSSYGKNLKKKLSAHEEREQLYEAYNLLHSLAQVSSSYFGILSLLTLKL